MKVIPTKPQKIKPIVPKPSSVSFWGEFVTGVVVLGVPYKVSNSEYSALKVFKTAVS